mmetsp:Transcript_23762/g.36707  ORF Transcript_23762/g.36707 Transcript_23762/m.36707 type:complete len:285 (-) Transcript_23762:107-961(-)
MKRKSKDATENNGNDGGSTRDPLLLDPPKSCLPENWDNSRYELWSIRLPKTMDVKSLDGATLNAEVNATAQSDESGVSLGTIQHLNKDGDDKEEYALMSGHSTENQSFRVLEPEQDDQQSGGQNYSIYLVPSNKAFDRHINVTKSVCTKDPVWTDLAPRMERAPRPKDKVIHAYSPIPQISGLKRRWMPMGIKVPEDVRTEEIMKRLRSGGAREDDDQVQSSSPGKIDTAMKEEDPSTPEQEAPSQKVSSSSEKKKSKKEKKSEKKARKEKKSAKKKKKQNSSQ